ncbi:DUF1833 family protein [Rheinheimera sp. 1928-s]|uniref:DUF1833 family protein n=1 Tax=Rheinheimera sp. 1928-s TaxID=3033803 RepID=UPI00262FAEA6|nr:DUF1833 family protein [Rheinheimera sp. 1928-s]MDF3127392.1 DUF1833 family protein [Rheinheimera sp. 1928-s]
MTVLDTLYVSGGPEVIFTTLEFNDGVKNFFLVEGYDELTAALEDGSIKTFEAYPMQVAQPARNADGTQDLQIALCNITGLVSTHLREMIAGNRTGLVTIRVYTEHDLSAPAERPFTLTVKGGNWTPMQADIVAGYMNILDTAWPRKLYTPNEYPGLRYIS